jgi:hypothetical protein
MYVEGQNISAQAWPSPSQQGFGYFTIAIIPMYIMLTRVFCLITAMDSTMQSMTSLCRTLPVGNASTNTEVYQSSSTDLGLAHVHSGKPITGPRGNAAQHLPSNCPSEYQDFCSIPNNMYNRAAHFHNVL